MTKVNCHISPVCGGIGSINLGLTFKRAIDDLWLESTLFYKFGTIYRQWLIHFDLDICDTISGRPTTNIMKKLLENFLVQHVSKQRCPFTNTLNITMNADNSSSTLFFEQIQGDYRNDNRFHTIENETIWGYDIKFTIKSKSGVNRTSMLDMG